MKEHILRECVNDLRDIAIRFHDHDSLRERLKTRLLEAFNEDAEWYRQLRAGTHSNDEQRS